MKTRLGAQQLKKIEKTKNREQSLSNFRLNNGYHASKTELWHSTAGNVSELFTDEAIDTLAFTV